jgi:hypothetical protein
MESQFPEGTTEDLEGWQVSNLRIWFSSINDMPRKLDSGPDLSAF